MTQPTSSPTQKRNSSAAGLPDRSITSSKRPKAGIPQRQRTNHPTTANTRTDAEQVDAADNNQNNNAGGTADNAAGDMADDEMDDKMDIDEPDETDPDATISDVHEAIVSRGREGGRSSSPCPDPSGGDPLTEENLRIHDAANLRAKMVEGRK